MGLPWKGPDRQDFSVGFPFRFFIGDGSLSMVAEWNIQRVSKNVNLNRQIFLRPFYRLEYFVVVVDFEYAADALNVLACRVLRTGEPLRDGRPVHAEHPGELRLRHAPLLEPPLYFLNVDDSHSLLSLKKPP